MTSDPGGPDLPSDYASHLPPAQHGLQRRVHAPVMRNHTMEPRPMPGGGGGGLDIRLADVLCIGPVILSSIYQLVGRNWIFAVLGKAHPVLTLAIRASIPSLLYAGSLVRTGDMPLIVALLVPLPYLFIDDPFLYWAGRRYGDRLTNYFIEQDPRWEGRIARGERMMEKYGFWAIIICNIPFVPIPVSVIYFIAGDTRMSIPVFVIANVIGLEIFIAASVGIGYALGVNAQHAVDVVTQWGGYIFGASMVFLVVYVVISTRRSMARLREQEEQRRKGGPPK